MNKLSSIDFGDTTYLRSYGLDTHFVLRINTVDGDSYGFIWGDADEYSEDKSEQIQEHLEDCVRIIRGY